MTTLELKAEVHKMIDHSSDSALQEAFQLLKEFQERDDSERARYRKNFEKVVSENRELLQRLAQ